jgi:hypothetical protein
MGRWKFSRRAGTHATAGLFACSLPFPRGCDKLETMLRPVALALLGLAAIASCGGSTETTPATTTGIGGTAGTGGSSVGGSGGSGGTGGTDGGNDVSVPPSLEGMAFDIEIPLNDAGYSWCQGDCTPATALVTKITDASLELVWGSTGHAGALQLTRAGARWQYDGKLLLGTVMTWDHAMCENESNLGPATFDFADHDNDGKVDLVIAGHQVSKMCSDDYTSGSESDVTLTGKPDARTAKALGPTDKIEPVHGLSIELDKPLEASAACSLVPSGGGSNVALTPTVMGSWVVGFSTTQILAPGSSFTAQITGKDFTGLGGPAAISVAIIDDYGVLAQDGFESGSPSGIYGAKVVDAWYVPAITGQRMLEVSPGTPSLLHLQRAGNEQNLVMLVRKYAACWVDGPFELKAGVVGASVTHDSSISMGSNPTTVSLEAATIRLGELQTVTIALPETGKDVLVYFRGDYYQGSGCSKVGAVVDDVMLK